jgi:hypothetical protein
MLYYEYLVLQKKVKKANERMEAIKVIVKDGIEEESGVVVVDQKKSIGFRKVCSTTMKPNEEKMRKGLPKEKWMAVSERRFSRDAAKRAIEVGKIKIDTLRKYFDEEKVFSVRVGKIDQKEDEE